jgi:hypothetical protein
MSKTIPEGPCSSLCSLIVLLPSKAASLAGGAASASRHDARVTMTPTRATPLPIMERDEDLKLF